MSDAEDIPEDEALAAEYVLRLLDAEAVDHFERRLAEEPALRAIVHDWEARLVGLAEDLPETAPPPRIKAALLNEIDPAVPSSARGLRLWRWLVPTALAAAVALFLVVTPLLRGPAFDPAFHATLASADSALLIEAGYAPDTNLFKVLRPEGDPRPGRVLELWVISEGAAAPISLGVLPEARDAFLDISPEIGALIDGGTLAVSDEPIGGSPTGAPTGDILATDEFFDI
ncbi:MAG: anti-sigma factor [Pseudomonadota bacterium]